MVTVLNAICTRKVCKAYRNQLESNMKFTQN